MTTELQVLVLAALLQAVQLILMAIPANLELGIKTTLSPRDINRLGGTLEEKLSHKTARLVRALNNHFEALLLFTIAAVAITLSGKSSSITAICAWAYLLARIAYIPAYVFAWVPARSIIWMIGFFATIILLLIAAF